MSYRKNQRIHSDKLGGNIPKGFYLILAVYEALQVVTVMHEPTGKNYTVVIAED